MAALPSDPSASQYCAQLCSHHDYRSLLRSPQGPARSRCVLLNLEQLLFLNPKWVGKGYSTLSLSLSRALNKHSSSVLQVLQFGEKCLRSEDLKKEFKFQGAEACIEEALPFD